MAPEKDTYPFLHRPGSSVTVAKLSGTDGPHYLDTIFRAANSATEFELITEPSLNLFEELLTEKREGRKGDQYKKHAIHSC